MICQKQKLNALRMKSQADYEDLCLFAAEIERRDDEERQQRKAFVAERMPGIRRRLAAAKKAQVSHHTRCTSTATP